MTFYAPDLDVLLSPYFGDSYCFRLTSAGRPRRGEIGLDFEPAAKRRHVERRGTLWFDSTSTSTALRTLRFTFVNLPAAANENLAAGAAVSYFRRDLLCRFGGLTIVVPPLTERLDDIPELLRHFLNGGAAGRSLRLLPEALGRLRSHVWPGNVRELKRVVDRLIVICETSVVRERDVSSAIGASEGVAASNLACHFERERLPEQLARNDRNAARVAKQSGVNPTTIYRRMVRVGITPPPF